MPTPPANERPRGLAPDARRESHERRILEATIDLICDGLAWQQLGIRQIAERAGISRTAFYDFFASKNEVLEHLVRGLHDELGGLLLDAEVDPTSVVDLTQVEGLLSTIADFMEIHGPVYRAFLDAASEEPGLSQLWDELLGRYVDLAAAAIEGARSAFPSIPATPACRPLAESLIMMTERTMLLLLRDDPRGSRRDERLGALQIVWERSVFGAAPVPAA